MKMRYMRRGIFEVKLNERRKKGDRGHHPHPRPVEEKKKDIYRAEGQDSKKRRRRKRRQIQEVKW